MERIVKVVIFAIISVNIVNVKSAGNTKITQRIILGTDLNHLAVDRGTGNMYVGGRNKLFQLTPNLQNMATVTTGPQYSSCSFFDYCLLECQHDILIDNINKVLLVDHNINKLITCNTVPKGTCSVRSLKNISLPEENDTDSVIARTESTVNVSRDQTTVAFIASDPFATEPTSLLYVGNSVILDCYNGTDVIAVSTRKLNKERMFYFSLGTSISIRPDLPIPYTIRYVHGFSSDGFAYFLTTQLKFSSSQLPNKYITKLVRVCQDDPNYYSYTEIPVDCVSDEEAATEYNLVQAAYVGKAGTDLAKNLRINTTDDVLFAIFSKGKGNDNIPTNKSAVCIYSLKSIRQKFMENIQSCFDGHGSKGLEFIRRYYDNENNSCINTNLKITEDFCGSEQNHPIGGERAISAVPVATYDTRLTAVAAIQHRRFTVAFIGTADGHLKKMILKSNASASAVQYDDIEIDQDTAISSDLRFDPNEMHLYVMTKDRVTKVKLYDCDDFLDCPQCSSISDPYCAWCFMENNCIPFDDTHRPSISNYVVIGVVVGSIILIITVIFVIITIKQNRGDRLKQSSNHLLENSNDENLEQGESVPNVEKYEFPENRLDFHLGEVLGEGYYGVVYRAIADGIVEEDTKTEVAVKKVKTDEAVGTFVKELKIMCQLGKHLNVVNLLGVITKNVKPRDRIIIVEYCKYGNLQKFLQNNCSAFIDQINRENDTIDSTITSNNRSQRAVANDSVYRPRPPIETPTIQCESQSNRQITTTDLVCWAFQVARGMEFLASRKVLHGDLAARNVLLCDDNVVKICDFGLARSLYNSSVYHKMGEDPLPLKWLAVESLRFWVFDTKTDVWAFGVLMSELFSLGEVPYPGMSPDETFCDKIKGGYRMPKPAYATDHIYEIMYSCWEKEPELRPSFDELADMISRCTERSITQRFIELNEPFLAVNSSDPQLDHIDYAEKETDHQLELLQNTSSAQTEYLALNLLGSGKPIWMNN